MKLLDGVTYIHVANNFLTVPEKFRRLVFIKLNAIYHTLIKGE